MSTAPSPVSDMLVTVKSRELQRGTLAEMASNPSEAARHLLAAAHLELVLAGDYANAGLGELALLSRLSAASCFWRAGNQTRAKQEFDDLIHEFPTQDASIRQVLAELEHNAD
jgi:hypothetical protein